MTLLFLLLSIIKLSIQQYEELNDFDYNQLIINRPKNLTKFEISLSHSNKESHYSTTIDFEFSSMYLSQEFKKYQDQIQEMLQQKQYYLVNYLAAGGQGEIYEGYQLKDTSKQDVIFKIHYNQNQTLIDEEIKIMKSLKDNIYTNKLLDRIQSNNFYIFILEKCQYSLADELEMINDKEIEFSEERLLIMIFDLIDGLISLRIFNTVHLDIKPSNILVTLNGTYIYSDFGCSSKVRQYETIQYKCRTSYYAPNELQNQSEDIHFKSDVYSLGKTLLKVIEVYESANEKIEEQLIQNYKLIIYQTMTEYKQYDRQDCQYLHSLFFNQIYFKEYKYFLEQYIKRINLKFDLFPSDQNKDIPYFSELQLYYLLKQQDIAQLIDLDREEISNIKNQIGISYANSGNSQEALNYFYQSLQIRQLLFKENKLLIVESLNNIGLAYQELGQFQSGLEYSLQSLQISQSLFEQNNTLIADTLNNISILYFKLNQTQFALQYSLRSLEVKQQLYKGNHISISITLNNIGMFYRNIGFYDNSLKYYLESLEMQTQLFNKYHPLIAKTLNNIGEYYQQLGQYQLALSYYLDSLEMKKSLFKRNHPSIALQLMNVGEIYYEMNNLENALEYFLKSIEILQQIYVPNHPIILQVQENIQEIKKYLS